MKYSSGWLGAILGLFLLSGLFYACTKETSAEDDNAPVPAGKQSLKLYLTDDPARFDEVLIDIRAVAVVVDTCFKNDDDDDDDDDCRQTVDLGVAPGIYDLLTLRNGVDTLLAQGLVPDGKVKRILITLGTNNSLVKDGITYPLGLFPGTNNIIVLKMKGNEWDQVGNRRHQLWLDFDVNRSIIVVRNNLFYLKPVLKPFTMVRTGSIEGRVTPNEALAVISIYRGADTAYAIPNRDGKFKVRGLLPGNYDLFVNAGNGYADTTITNIDVMMKKETKLATIVLKK